MNAHDAQQNGYNEKSCSLLEKLYYRPIEAAIRWCGLFQREALILEYLDGKPVPGLNDFPDWPCLRTNTERIFYGIENDEFSSYGEDGRVVRTGKRVAREQVTITHDDLKAWMMKYRPDQKPAFLFDEIERTTHSAINAESFRALQADREALKSRVEAVESSEKASRAKLAEAEKELEKLRATATEMTTKERRTKLVIIAAACEFAGLDFKKSSKTAQVISNTAEKMGLSLSDSTIEMYLKKIPDALETRMK